jgi:prepilin signal peptidase PulO-like enzyme (type II secretory pathway)
MINIILFILGASLGSFINVLAIRYKENKFILSQDIIFGRSKCPNCGKELKWFELIPILSFLIQGRKCRKCSKKLSLQYPLIEILCGGIVLFVYQYFKKNFFIIFALKTINLNFYLITSLWILILLTLVLITLIDLKIKIIPNETLVFILILGIILNTLLVLNKNQVFSFTPLYASLFGFTNNFWINKLVSFVFALIFFSSLIILTQGKGMGMGDLKLMAVLSIVFSWPDILIISFLSFILGSIASLFLLINKNKKLNSAIPFGPFIALAVYLLIFYGDKIIKLYFILGSKLFPNI